MGQNLENKHPGGAERTFEWLLHVGGNTLDTLRTVSLGNGTDSALSISGSAAKIAGDLEVTGTVKVGEATAAEHAVRKSQLDAKQDWVSLGVNSVSASDPFTDFEEGKLNILPLSYGGSTGFPDGDGGVVHCDRRVAGAGNTPMWYFPWQGGEARLWYSKFNATDPSPKPWRQVLTASVDGSVSTNLHYTGDHTHVDQDLTNPEVSLNARQAKTLFLPSSFTDVIYNEDFVAGDLDYVDGSYKLGRNGWRTSVNGITPNYKPSNTDPRFVGGLVKISTNAVLNSIAKIALPQSGIDISGSYNFTSAGAKFSVAFFLDDLADIEFFIGYGDSGNMASTAPTSWARFSGLYFNDSTNANFTTSRWAGGNASDISDTGVTPVLNKMYKVEITYISSSQIKVKLVDEAGAVVWEETRSSYANNESQGPVLYLKTRSTAAKSIVLDFIGYSFSPSRAWA